MLLIWQGMFITLHPFIQGLTYPVHTQQINDIIKTQGNPYILNPKDCELNMVKIHLSQDISL